MEDVVDDALALGRAAGSSRSSVEHPADERRISGSASFLTLVNRSRLSRLSRSVEGALRS